MSKQTFWKLLISLMIIFGSSTGYAFDYKSCMAMRFERNDVDSGMREILTQVMQLSGAGKSEDVNFEAMGYLSAAVDAYVLGFTTARIILLNAKFSAKDDELAPVESFKLISGIYIKSLNRLNDMINENIAFVKSQSVRDDLKALVIKNKSQLRRLSPCAD